jgi:non-ribosomal peptide synthetase-like protein
MKHVRVEAVAAADPQPLLLHAWFESQAGRRPGHPAVECRGEVLTYRELDEAANRVAAALRAHGVGAGALIGLYMTKSCALFAGLLGILKAGAGYVPIDPRFPPERIGTIFEDAAVAAVLTDETLASVLEPHVAAPVLLAAKEMARPWEPVAEPVVVMPHDPCYVIYTSGSTGKPKGVVIEHRNAVGFVRAMPSVYRLDQDDRVYQGFSIAFDASVEEIWGAFSCGATLVVPPEDIARSCIDAADFINSTKVTFFSTVPSFLATMTGELPTVRLLVLGGEVCAPELVSRWAMPGRRLLNTYGPTEATVVATAAECLPGQPVTIGVALPGYVTHVLDERLQPVATGGCGELFIGGDSVARGYLNRPDLTAERFIRDPFAGGPDARLYRTSDLVRLGENGQLHFIGRADGQVKIRGFRIELSEIEALLMEHPAIRAAAVTVVDIEGIKEIAAYVVPETAAAELDRSPLRDLLRRRLPEYMVPKYLEALDALPSMTSGKVDRKALPPPQTLLGGADRVIVEPASDMEREIAAVWSRHFMVTPLSVEDDFFVDLHGHSMIAGRIVGDLRERLDTVRVSVRDLYSRTTVRALARHLESIGVAPAGTSGRRQAAAGEGSTAGERARLTWRRWPCAALQALALAVYYGVICAPLVIAGYTVLLVRDGRLDWGAAAVLLTLLGFALWPAGMVLSIAVKWLVIGRYRAGRYPLWGGYYFRWWLASRFQELSCCWLIAGTPLMTLYFRAMGAKVGARCTLATSICTAFDLISIGDNTSVGAETHLCGYRVENGCLVLGRVTIGSDCYVGMHCYLGLDVTMQDRAQLDDLSLLSDGAMVEQGRARRGSPARPAEPLSLPEGLPPAGRARTALFGLAHLLVIYAVGYLLILSGLPFLALLGYALHTGNPTSGAIAALAAAPVSMLCYILLLAGTKRLVVGRVRAGAFPVHSAAYLRYWTMNLLLDGTRVLLLPLYATLYFPSFLRLLGARVGRKVEVSTIVHAMPDLLEIGDGSFLADACLVGGCRIHDGMVELCHNRIGKRTFVGNSALIPTGVSLGDDSLIGVLSTPPSGVLQVPDGTRWLGSPGFQLPATEQHRFDASQTFAPSAALICGRALLDALRVLLPPLIVVALLVAFCSGIVALYEVLPLAQALLVAPAIAAALTVVAVASVALLKAVCMGRFEPTIRPLWCPYVWRNELVNALYETVATPMLTPLLGTPFAAPLLRWMGCRIGRWVFLETTLFSEFDLVTIGDRAALNQGVTIQNHLFEDRVMKSDHIRIEADCSIGNMAVVLYNTRMHAGSCLGPLSVLMKGEALPAGTRWHGIPTEPVDAASAAEHGVRSAAIARRWARALACGRRLLGSSSELAIQSGLRSQSEVGGDIAGPLWRSRRPRGLSARPAA